MNFIDKYKEEMKSADEMLKKGIGNEEPKDGFRDMANLEFLKAIMPPPKSAEEVRETASNEIKFLADTFSDTALMFHDKLKGKFTSGQIQGIITSFIEYIGEMTR